MRNPPTSLADISRQYLKSVLPKTPHRRWFRNYNGNKDLPEEIKELDFSLMLFSVNHQELHSYLFDTYISGLSVNQLIEKYNCSKRTVMRRREQALEAFYLYIPRQHR